MKLPQFISIILTALLSSSHAIATERPPNFIFILSDDIAQGALGSYGQELIKTPRLDQMAAEGTRYMQAYCGTTERRKNPMGFENSTPFEQ